MTCKLCHNDLPLQNSHILPEFVYSQLYDEKHRMHVLSLQEKRPRPYAQKGLREKLLCRNCESLLSGYETYACTALDDKHTDTPLDRVVIVEDVEYKRFKLFLLSVLWRASVSKLLFFENVNLGPYEEEIREMILRNDPGPSDRFGVYAFALVDTQTIQSDLIVQPSRIRVEGRFCYRFIFGGFMWVFVMPCHLPPPEMKSLFLREDNTLCFIIGEYRECGPVIEFAKSLKKIGRIY